MQLRWTDFGHLETVRGGERSVGDRPGGDDSVSANVDTSGSLTAALPG